MQRLSEAEKRYIEDGISQGFRLDGRGYLEYRGYTVETGVIPSANGSSRVYNIDSDVIVGLKCEISTPKDETPNEGSIQVTVDCASSIGSDMETRNREELGNSLSDLVEELCLSKDIINREKLSILSNRFCWNVFADVTVVKSGGCLIDVISIGLLAALCNTIIPKVKCMEKDVDDANAPVAFRIEAEERESAGTLFPIENLPVCVTVGQIGNRFVWDMSIEEERCCQSTLTVAIDNTGSCVGLHKAGSISLESSVVPTLIQNCQVSGKKIQEQLNEVLNQLQETRYCGRLPIGFVSS